jgi:hypothetical protein
MTHATRCPHKIDILLTYPIGSLVFWRRIQWQSDRVSYVPARVVGKCERQGNGRLSLDVLYIGSNVTGANVLYIRHHPQISIANIIMAREYYAICAKQPTPGAANDAPP